MTNYKEIISRISPDTVGQYLTRNNYTKVADRSDYGAVYEGKDKAVFVVPRNPESRDYIRRITGIAEYMCDEELGFHDVLCMISLPVSDLFKFRVESPDTASGLLHLNYGQRAVKSLFDVIRFSAAGASTRLREYKNMSEEAKAYADSCRFGQTEIGSYVLKVFCPVNPSSIAISDYEPFGRRATQSVMQNFSFIADERSEDPREPLPPAMNQQVLVAMEKLKPISDFSDTEIRVRYEAVRTEPGVMSQGIDQGVEVESLDLGPFAYSRAAAVRQRLARAEREGREVVEGFITDLHKDLPSIENAENRISLTVKYEGVSRKVTVRLPSAEYTQAIRWHEDSLKVRLDALFDKRERPWSVVGLYSLQPTPTEPSLFS